jgi:Flp pilus assembly protein TadG
MKSTKLRAHLQNEDGSISVLVFGLFAVVLLSGVVLTDISAVIVAQRSLVQATESAAQSAAHALDLEQLKRWPILQILQTVITVLASN